MREVDWIRSDSPQWLKRAAKKIELMPQAAFEVRERAREDLYFYAKLVNKGYQYGSIHAELFRWMQDYSLFGIGEEGLSNKLIMLPRAHLKSHMLATWASWMILRHPEITILYLSATAELAELQLGAIKDIMESSIFQRYFPEMIHPQDGKRARWSSTKIKVDHPYRKQNGIRDNTIATAGLTTNTTGWHADVILADDLVVPENAYTEDGRMSVIKKSAQFTSIRNTGGFTLAAGTRYHPSDIYADWKEQFYEVYDDDGVLIDKKLDWDIQEFPVETDNIFLWPRSVREDGKAFGFDLNSLARIKAGYSKDVTQFHAQYYNNPNDPSSDRISRDTFQYLNPRLLSRESGRWKYNGRKLNIYASIDFAYSLTAAADWTAIVVVGVDSDSNYYVLDIDRFKTKKTYEYFKRIAELHSKWKFNKLNTEITAAQAVISEAIKDYIKKEGMSLSVVESRPNRREGSKEERIAAALEHLYDDHRVWHIEGGWTSTLEDELVQARPPHDDIKDALAAAVTIAIRPAQSTMNAMKDFLTTQTQSRFGGVGY